MKDTYTCDEIAKALGITWSAADKRARCESWQSVYLPGKGRGGKTRVFVFRKLPRDVREAVREWEARRRLEEIQRNPPSPPAIIEPPQGQAPTVVMPRDPRIDEVVREVMAQAEARRLEKQQRLQPIPAGIPERAKRIGLAKYALVHTWRDAVRNAPWGERRKVADAFLHAYNAGQLLPHVYEVVGPVAYSTLCRLDQQLREADDDFLAVTDTRGGWMKYGTTKWRDSTLLEESRRVFLKCYLQPNRPSVSTAIRATRMILQARGIREPAHDVAFYRWLKWYASRHQHVVVLMREGEKAYKDKVAPYADRAGWILNVGDCLVADGHPLDFFVRHPATGKPARMKLIVFFDWASRYPAGWQIMPTENTVAVHAALRRAVITLGKLPLSVYVDHGKAFKAKVFTETDPDMGECTGLYARLGIAVFTARPYEPRTKIVERFFLTLSDQFETVLPTYCGSSIERKPAWMQRNETLHKAWHQARYEGWIPDIREAAYLISRYIDWYVEQPHRGLNGKTPKEVFEAGKGPGVDELQLGWDFLWREERPVRRCRVRLYGIDYEGDCLHGIEGRVVVHYDCSDLSRAWAVDREGRLLGEIYPVAALHPLAMQFGDQVAVDQVRSALDRQRRLKRQTIENLRELGVIPEDVRDVVDAPWGMAALIEERRLGAADATAEPLRVASPESPQVARAVASAGGPRKEADDEQMERLRLVYERLDAERSGDEDPPLERPEWFASEIERYEWCWRARHIHKMPLSDEDHAFMAYYQKTSEFIENFAERYGQLGELYGLGKKEVDR